MVYSKNNYLMCILGLSGMFFASGCTVKAVGDPNRPITINAHITLDVHGMKETANDIEGYVSGEKSAEDLKASTKKENAQ